MRSFLEEAENRGIERGFERGRSEGFNAGRSEERKVIMNRLIEGGMAPQEAARYTGVI